MVIAGQTAENNPSEHTLVVIFLRGGADGLNMVVPVEDDNYYKLRPTIGIKKKDTLRLDDLFGLHPRLAALERVYKDGALAILHGAGSEDTTRSHFEAQDLMEHGGKTGGGWIGRWLQERLAGDTNVGPLSAITLGKRRVESMRGSPASIVMESPESLSFDDPNGHFAAGLRRLYESETGPMGHAGLHTLDAVARMEEFSDSPYVPAHGAEYRGGRFAQDLKLAAQLIKSGLGVTALAIDLNGWDTHFVAVRLMDPLLALLANGLASFYQDMGDAMARCTVVVMTEFGRRAYENASFGTDHGRGSIMFVMGGGVRGGRVISKWKGLEKSHLDGPGDLPVEYSYKSVLASVLLRHGGISSPDGVFPEPFGEPLDLYA